MEEFWKLLSTSSLNKTKQKNKTKKLENLFQQTERGIQEKKIMVA